MCVWGGGQEKSDMKDSAISDTESKGKDDFRLTVGTCLTRWP